MPSLYDYLMLLSGGNRYSDEDLKKAAIAAANARIPGEALSESIKQTMFAQSESGFPFDQEKFDMNHFGGPSDMVDRYEAAKQWEQEIRRKAMLTQQARINRLGY